MYAPQMDDVDLAKLLEPHKTELRQLAQHLVAGERPKFVAGVAALVGTLATGNPAVAALAPFAEKAVSRAFASAADVRLHEEIVKLDADNKERALVASIADAVEVLLGQALLQLVRVEHRVKDEVINALGGLREELSTFREEFQRGLDAEAVRVDMQRVLARGVGIRVEAGARQRVFVREQIVSEEGIGIVLRG